LANSNDGKLTGLEYFKKMISANDQRPGRKTMTLEADAMTAATPPIAISRLGQIAINVHNVDRATAFYRDILGLPLLFTAGSLAFFDCGGVRLMLTHPEKPEFDHPSSVLYFAVPDITGAHQQMLNSGVRFEDEPHLIARMPNHDLWMTFFHDSEENMLALMCEKPK
jgi:methylmalonyl-CoA/ethylmalonyl-CoA epimerase